MSKFTGPLVISFLDPGRSAVIWEDLVWELDYEGSGMTVTVPTGFVSDGASVPRILWWLMPPWGDKGTRAAILHDYLLELAKKLPLEELHQARKVADRNFYLALRALGVGRIRARILWAGVRAYSIYYRLLGVYLGLVLP